MIRARSDTEFNAVYMGASSSDFDIISIYKGYLIKITKGYTEIKGYITFARETDKGIFFEMVGQSHVDRQDIPRQIRMHNEMAIYSYNCFKTLGNYKRYSTTETDLKMGMVSLISERRSHMTRREAINVSSYGYSSRDYWYEVEREFIKMKFKLPDLICEKIVKHLNTFSGLGDDINKIMHMLNGNIDSFFREESYLRRDFISHSVYGSDASINMKYMGTNKSGCRLNAIEILSDMGMNMIAYQMIQSKPCYMTFTRSNIFVGAEPVRAENIEDSVFEYETSVYFKIELDFNIIGEVFVIEELDESEDPL